MTNNYLVGVGLQLLGFQGVRDPHVSCFTGHGGSEFRALGFRLANAPEPSSKKGS